MNPEGEHLEEQCPLMPFLPKRIPNWLEELKVMTNHFGVRVIELKSHNSKLSPTNPFFRNLFQWIASVTWRSSAQAGLKLSSSTLCTSGAPCCLFMTFPNLVWAQLTKTSICVCVHFTLRLFESCTSFNICRMRTLQGATLEWELAFNSVKLDWWEPDKTPGWSSVGWIWKVK